MVRQKASRYVVVCWGVLLDPGLLNCLFWAAGNGRVTRERPSVPTLEDAPAHYPECARVAGIKL